MLPAAMHHFRGMGAPWRRCRTSGEGVCFARSGCRTTNGQGVVLARRTQEREKQELEREQKMQTAMLTIKKKFGKNAILRGMNLEEGATAKDRNGQIGGHRA